MKTANIYFSKQHQKTKKLVDAIAAKNEVTLIDAMVQTEADLSDFDVIGLASGITFGKYYPKLLAFIENNLPENKKVFYIHTAGDPRAGQNSAAKAIADARGCETLGTYFCKGFDTYGPFKLIGGIAKGHPTSEEITEAEKFYSDILSDIN